MRIICSLLLSLSLSFFLGASNALAADYIWSAYMYNVGTYTGSSPAAACNATIAAYNEPRDGDYTLDGVHMLNAANPHVFICDISSDKQNLQISIEARRSGDSCPLETTYNAGTGNCDGPEPDPCEDSAGATKQHEHRIGDLGSGEHSEPPSSVCEGSCQYAWDQSAASSCYRYVANGDLNGAFCKYTYKANGVSCTSDNPQPGSVFDQPPTKPPSDTTPEYFSDNSCSSWVTNPDGTQSKSCSSTTTNSQPGNMDCTGSSSTLVCGSGNPPPFYSDTTKDQQTTTTTGSDGSTTSTTTTDTTQTTCKGTKPCTTETSTETDSTTTDANGNTTDESSECTGDACESEEEDQAAEEEEEQEEEGVEREVSGESCSSDLSCAGDAIDCAILRQQKEMRCSLDWASQQDAVLAEAGSSEYELGTEEIDASDLFSGPSAGRWLSPTCPADRVIHLATTGTSITFSWSFVCQYASGLGNLLVALASLFFAVYVGRAFGGD